MVEDEKMYDDVPAILLQSVYRALDDDVEWSEILDPLVVRFDVNDAALGIVELHRGGRQTYRGLANAGVDGHSYPRPGSLLGKLNSDEDALAGVKLPTVVETHHHSSDGIHEVHAGGWLRDGAIVLLELRRRSPFGDGERRQIRRIVAHLARVVRTRSKIRHTETAEQQSRAALNVLRVPAAIVDAKCAVLARNRLFDRVIERGTLELGVDNRVRGARPSLTGRLRDNICCIADGGGSGEPEEDSSELTVVLDARPQHRTTIVARPITLADATTPRVLLSVYHPDADHSIDHELLEQLYDFTPTEAQTAARLAEGYTIDEIADFRRCAKSTVRTHVKRILQKTGTHRQAELVRVILGSPAAKLTAWGA